MDVILVILFLTLNRFHILFWVDLYFEQVNTDSEAAVRKKQPRSLLSGSGICAN